ncbi:hypothetical protein AB0478_11200 [Streptomyces sp. NPDC051917]|uniref:hypothetical protein n=1 Tax=Streptomyces sp. NPDC051917 TaxID=3154754 RepID=UPI00344D7BAD
MAVRAVPTRRTRRRARTRTPTPWPPREPAEHMALLDALIGGDVDVVWGLVSGHSAGAG